MKKKKNVIANGKMYTIVTSNACVYKFQKNFFYILKVTYCSNTYRMSINPIHIPLKKWNIYANLLLPSVT